MAHNHTYPEASKLFRDVIERQDNSKGQGDYFSVWYSFASVAVAANHADDALQYLREALNRGYKDADALMADDNLKNLHPNPNFQESVAELKRPLTKWRPSRWATSTKAQNIPGLGRPCRTCLGNG
jgi:hypothetical protein